MSSVIYTVTGRGQFPIDMLRYDCAWPLTGDDAAHITESFGADVGIRRWTVTLESDMPRPAYPCIARWTSFGCQVEVRP